MVCGYVTPTICNKLDCNSTICPYKKNTKNTRKWHLNHHPTHTYQLPKTTNQTGAAGTSSQSHTAAPLGSTKPEACKGTKTCKILLQTSMESLSKIYFSKPFHSFFQNTCIFEISLCTLGMTTLCQTKSKNQHKIHLKTKVSFIPKPENQSSETTTTTHTHKRPTNLQAATKTHCTATDKLPYAGTHPSWVHTLRTLYRSTLGQT